MVFASPRIAPGTVFAALVAALAASIPMAAAQAQENPLLSRPTTATGRLSTAPDRPTPLEAERNRVHLDGLEADIRARRALDDQGRLDPLQRRETLEMEIEARRIGRTLEAQETRPGLTPGDAQLNDTLRRDPLPGSGYPLPRLGRGGATLKPGIGQPPPRKPPIPPG